MWQLNFNRAFFTTGSDWTSKTALIDRYRRATLTCSARDCIQEGAPSPREVAEVGPPLFANGPSSGSLPVTSFAIATNVPPVVLST